MGEILDFAIEDSREIYSGDLSDFSTTLKFTPTAGDEFSIEGWAFVHSTSFDDEGMPVIATNSHITFNENVVTELGYEVRDSANKVNIQGWLVEFTQNGITYTCKLAEPRPDTTMNSITVNLVNYVSN